MTDSELVLESEFFYFVYFVYFVFCFFIIIILLLWLSDSLVEWLVGWIHDVAFYACCPSDEEG
eukprot:m.9900 g.9900  ORF g.9900 m.9900 type:complete len:63 (-) comp5858_c0_seq1:102-290(-)